MKKFINEIIELFKKYYFLLFCAFALILPNELLMGLLSPGVFDDTWISFVQTLFNFAWIFLVIFLCVIIFSKKIGKILFGILSSAFIILSFCEYVYYKIFNQFFWLKSIMLAGEGDDYFGHAIAMIDAKLIIYTVFSIVFLVVGLMKWVKPKIENKLIYSTVLIPVLILTCTHTFMLPGGKASARRWDLWRNPKVVYENFSDINKSIEISGIYQFTYRSIHSMLFPNANYDEEEIKMVDEFFEKKNGLQPNEYTDFFKGKNVIAVMMESMDSWVIDETHTPTLYKMMNEGIRFSNYNAPLFGAGFTFGSEFVFNTGFFTPISAVSASTFNANSFPYSMARLFKDEGYATNSFHFNSSEFYNRGIMHKTFGYEKYNGFEDFGLTGVEAELDSNILKNDEIYKKMTEKQPFFDFLITYSAHLPYKGESAKLQLAREYRPDLIDEKVDLEKNNIQILAADTDEFFRQLLERLEGDGLLENTVIVVYTDHFAYGVSNEEFMLEEWKKDIKYRVPAFIYSKGIEPMTITKPMMTIDWLPTIVNLFGLKNEGKYIGNDIFDPNNNGFVYYETWEWLDDKMHYVHSEEEPHPDDVEYIEMQNQRVRESIKANDAVILGDYYKKR